MVIQTEFLKYGNGLSRQIIKKYSISPTDNIGHSYLEKKRFILIHGGAWRDPNNTCADFDKFVEYWNQLVDDDADRGNKHDIIIYSIDYQLSSDIQFPVILIEVLKALEVINLDSFDNEDDCENIQFCIVGHSVGSTFITQIFEYEKILNKSTGTMGSYKYKLPIINKAIFMDGIYNIQLMLEEYPQYDFFVNEEFGSVDNGIQLCNSVGKNDNMFPKAYKELKNIIILHSLNDELLSLKQPDNFKNWLEFNGVKKNGKEIIDVIYDDFGEHNEVYQNENVAKILFDKTVR